MFEELDTLQVKVRMLINKYETLKNKCHHLEQEVLFYKEQNKHLQHSLDVVTQKLENLLLEWPLPHK